MPLQTASSICSILINLLCRGWDQILLMISNYALSLGKNSGNSNYFFGVSWVFLSNTLREVGFSIFKESETLSKRRLLRYARNDKSSHNAFFLSLRGTKWRSNPSVFFCLKTTMKEFWNNFAASLFFSFNALPTKDLQESALKNSGNSKKMLGVKMLGNAPLLQKKYHLCTLGKNHNCIC